MPAFLNDRRRLASCCFLLTFCMAAAGCGSDDVSQRAYDYAKALYSICNRQDESRLEQFVRLVQTDAERGEISPDEAEQLNEIVAQARAGQWQDANLAARQLLEDQVEGR